MASIRRTQLPAYYERAYTNGGSPLSVSSTSSPSHKLLPSSATLSSSPSASSSNSAPFEQVSFGLRRLLLGNIIQKHSRKSGIPPWKRPLFQYFLFFMFGFLLGISPIADVEDLHRRQDLSFEIRPSLHTDLTSAGAGGGGGGGGISVENRAIETVEPKAITSVKLDVRRERFDFVPRKQLIVVTPTYNRALQAFYLNRLGQTLRLVPPPLLWIVVEMNSASAETAEMLRKSGVMHRHLVCKKNSTDFKDRGVHQRNVALEHIELHRLDGIVYFADDDNVYSLGLFEQMREIRRFGTWPVAMLAHSKNKAVLEGPVCNGSEVIGWHTNEKSKQLRRFHVDMSGFAFNSTILWDPKRWHRLIPDAIRQLDKVKEGFQETTFIEQVVEDESQMEGTPHGLNCSLTSSQIQPINSKHYLCWQQNVEDIIVESV
ncbi:hypothetical protein MRB53_007237 [Persea americana]|uniref:Uncharacterized protein n=1 Tax=Persea americana TaxID=3435 RepID=A0ACC2MIF1_PERAE|nr:hypothetical protein MRB53_007237 [Persea americana]